MSRSQSRELAFKLIYSNKIQKDIDDEQIEIFIQENDIKNKESIQYIKETFKGIKENKENISNLIEKNLKEKWTLERISKIDLSILQLAIYEILYSKLDYKIVINEAVELAKKYGDDSSKMFINGILASVVREKI